MVDGLSPIDGGAVPTGPQRVRAAEPAPRLDVASSDPYAVPAQPPAEVLDALETAARVMNELDRHSVSLRLELDRAANTIRAHADGPAGSVQLSLARLLNVLSGDTAGVVS